MHKSKPKVSIIIPVYNISAYLRRCLDSAVEQTLCDIEIIVVNDESPDPEDTVIMREYKAKYPELINLIFHKKNLGLGGARNTGIKAAKGEYLMFVDSDDWVTIDATEKFYNCAVINNADLVVCTSMYKNNKELYSFPPNKTPNYFIQLFFIQKQLVIEKQAFFPERCYYEDNAVAPIWELMAKKIAYINKGALYYYFTRSDSIMGTSRQTFRFYTDLLKAYDYTLDMARKLSLFEKNKTYLSYLILTGLFTRFYVVLENFPEKFNETVNLMLNFIKRNNDLIFDEIKLNKSIIKFFQYLISQGGINWEQFYDITKYYPFMEIQNIFNELKNKDFSRFTVWGAGKYGTKFCSLCSDLNISVEVTDNNSKLFGTALPSGHIVKPFKELAKKTDAIIVTNSRFYDEIAQEAKKFGNFEIVDVSII